MATNKDINIHVIEKLTKLQKDQRLASDNTMIELKKILCELYHCDDNKNPILINGELPNPSRIGQLEEVVNRIEERLDGSRSNYSRHNNRRRVVARRGRRGRGGRRTQSRRRKKSTRRKGGARTKKNTPFFTDPKTFKKVINPSFVKSKPQPVTLNITGVGPVTFDPKEVAQQRRMMTQHKNLSPTWRKNRGGRRKKRTKKRRKSKGRKRRRKRTRKRTKRRRRRTRKNKGGVTGDSFSTLAQLKQRLENHDQYQNGKITIDVRMPQPSPSVQRGEYHQADQESDHYIVIRIPNDEHISEGYHKENFPFEWFSTLHQDDYLVNLSIVGNDTGPDADVYPELQYRQSAGKKKGGKRRRTRKRRTRRKSTKKRRRRRR